MAGERDDLPLKERLWALIDRYYLAATVLGAFLLWILVVAAIVANVQLPQVQEEELGQAVGGGGATPLGPPEVVITLYAAELPGGKFGFGFSPDEITSPGPEIRVKQGQVVEIRLINLGNVRHAFAVVQEVAKTNPKILFNSAIGSPNNPIPPGSEGSVIFVASQAGTFYYQCPVSNHGPKGMWGVFTVEP
ncbi:multicopper oxidase domain-containing protein [Aeropyrum camini]|uniref:Uncharacterized copper-binding protein n=1 Tax=Aeropyrum camini SY1 = JCM 12091 TaxID=1198449 RepID=U3T7J0_9CREN|nr:multicopper oxidase domain-containing protein [Aeropyrum camini]BAN89487.1 uncharacterized copper-binding protein [Aeropyrum camini SY1 = JCM 12091]